MTSGRLVGAKDWFDLFTAGSPSPYLLVSKDSVLGANDAAARLYGYPDTGAMRELPVGVLLDGRAAERIAMLAGPKLNGNAQYIESTPLNCLSGPLTSDLLAWTARLDSEPLIVLRVAPESARDQQDRFHRHRRELRLLSSTLALMLHEEHEAGLLHEFCRLGVEAAGYRMAWVGLARKDQDKTIEPVAHHGLEDDYFCDLHFSWGNDGQPLGKGPSGTAVRSGRPCAMHNLLENPLYRPWRDAAARLGYNSTASFPLALGEESGVFNLCASEPEAFDESEVALLEQVAGALAFGVLSLRHQSGLTDALEKLRSAKEFISGFLDNAPLSFCVTQPDGRVILANPRWRELFAAREVPEPNASLEQVVGEQATHFLRSIQDEVARQRKPLKLEQRVRLPQGSRQLRAVGFPLKDANGRLTGVGNISEDITEQLRSLRALRAANKRLEGAERIAGLGHYEYDFSTGRAVWSKNMYRLYGVDPATLAVPTLDYVVANLLHPDDKEEFLAGVERAAQSAGRHTSEYRILWPDGQVRQVLAYRMAHRGPSGQVERLTGTVQDVTELREEQRKLAESRDEFQAANEELQRANARLEASLRQLQESEQRYLNVVEQSPGGIAVTHQGKITYCNQALARICGFSSPAELQGRPLASLIHEEDRPAFVAALVKLSSVGQISPLLELRGLRPDGQHVDLALRLALVERDGTAAVQATFSDFTLNRKLERQVQQMQKMEAVGMLAGGIAHDFNNILFGILGYADLIRDQLPAGSEALEDLEELSHAGLRGKELVSQLLVFTRQTAHELKPLRLSALIKETLKFLRATIPTTITIESHLLDTDDQVLGDPTAIHQVMMNLFTNAWQAMPDGGKLEVSVERLEVDEEFAAAHEGLKKGRTLLLRVSDTGIGMDKATADRIFEPFFTTKDQGEGTGLGLSVVYGIIRSMGGTVHTYTELGQGTSFHIYLPRLAGADEPAAVGTEARPAPRGTERVMVVDDDERLMRMVSKILTRLGYQVEGFANSSEALAAFRATPDAFQLIYTDQTMPGLTGLQLARAILHLRPMVPVVLATGFTSQHLADEAMMAGIARLVSKPLVTAALADAVRAALDEAAERAKPK